MSKAFTRSGQIIFNHLRMFLQVSRSLFKWYMIAVLLTTLVSIYFMTSHFELMGWYDYLKGQAFALMQKTSASIHVSTQFGEGKLPVHRVIHHRYFLDAFNEFNKTVYWSFCIALGIWTLIFIGIVVYFLRRGNKLDDSELERGASIDTVKKLNQRLAYESRQSPFAIGQLHLIKDSEVKHLLLHGTTGTGKTQTLKILMRQIRAHNHRAIVFDDGGEMVAEFYDENRGDIILNPFDERCARWNLWHECEHDADYDNLAAALIPEDSDKEKFWTHAARTLFADIVRYHKDPERQSYTQLLESCLNMSLDALQEALQDKSAEQLVDKSIAKTALTIRAVITTHIKPLRFLPDDPEQANFSLRNWVLDEQSNPGACVFIISRDRDHEALRSLISLWIGLVATHVKSLPRDRNRRIWMLMDEVTKLNRLPSLPDTLATGRNYGLCVLLGFQNRAQMRMTYGRDTADAILDLLSTQFYFRSPSKQVAEEVSAELGECEVVETTQNYTYGSDPVRDGVQLNKNKRNVRIVTYTEIQTMDDLEAYVKLPANLPRCKITLPKPRPSTHAKSPFLPRDVQIDEALEAELDRAARIPDGITEQSEAIAGQAMVQSSARQNNSLASGIARQVLTADPSRSDTQQADAVAHTHDADEAVAAQETDGDEGSAGQAASDDRGEPANAETARRPEALDATDASNNDQEPASAAEPDEENRDDAQGSSDHEHPDDATETSNKQEVGGQEESDGSEREEKESNTKPHPNPVEQFDL